MAEVVVRVATPEDAEALVLMHRACWREAYPGLLPDDVIEATFADLDALTLRRVEQLRRRDLVVHLADAEGELVGFASSGPARLESPPAALELYALYCRMSWWGNGVADRLLAASLAGRPAYLWVLAANGRAVSFYRRHGFEADGTLKNDRGLAAELRMVRPDPSPSGP